MGLVKEGYIPRLVDPLVTETLAAMGAVSVEGPKWCGKTWTSLTHAESVFYVADPAGGFGNRQLAILDPQSVLSGPQPRLIDEWQEVPGLWDAVRFQVDQDQGKSLFLLTGSATPVDGATVHSGVGRIGRVRMRPMTLVESGESTGVISLKSLVAGDSIKPARSEMDLRRLIELVCRGGWPGVVRGSVQQAQVAARNYLDTVARIDISEIGGVQRDPARVMALFASLARNTATLVSYPTLRRDIAQFSEEDLSITTIRNYVALLERLFIIEEIPAWSPHLRSSTRLRASPKRCFADPSLAVAAMNASPEQLLADLNTFGFLFESMCLRDLLVYADVHGARLSHYRDDSGLEADLVMVFPNGQWVALEIKTGFNQIEDAAAHLLRLSAKLQQGGLRPPSCLGVVVGIGGIAQRRPDGVCVLPIDMLGP